MRRHVFLTAVALALVLAWASAASAQGWRSAFRNFKKNPPRVGERAPLFTSIDEHGKKMDMRDRVGRSHLVIVFGALT